MGKKSMIKVGHVVRVVRQPENLSHRIEGAVGIVEGISALLCVSLITEDGRRQGSYFVPEDCLALEQSQVWLTAKCMLEERDAEYERGAVERSDRWRSRVAEVAAKYGVSSDTALSIHRELEAFSG